MDPDWVEPSNDEKHAKETTPLLGDGDFSLQDPEDPLAAHSTATDKSKADNQKKPEKGADPEHVPNSRTGNAKAGEGKESGAGQSTSHKPHTPSQNPCLWLFHLFAGVAVLSSLLLIMAQLLPFFLPRSKTSNLSLLESILKIYLSCICLAFVVVEANLPVPFVRTSSLLQSFFSRGFIYSFIGLVCTNEAYSERVDDSLLHSSERFHIGWASIFMQVVSWVMFALGVVYMAMGLCCLRRVRDRMEQKEKESWKQYRQDMKKWRESRE